MLKLQHSDWRANLVKDLVLNKFSTNESTQIIAGHVIYNPAYTYKFQLKTTVVFYWLVRFASLTLFGEPGEQMRSNLTLVEPTGNGNKEKSLEVDTKLDTSRYGNGFI